MDELLTIGIVTHDDEAYIKQAIDAALSTGAAVIVSDDASTDGTRSVVESYGDAITAIFNDDNYGQFSRGANQVLDACKTEWVSFIAGDDYVLPGFEECCLDGYDWVYCDLTLVDSQNRDLTAWDYNGFPTDWKDGLYRARETLSPGVPHIGAFRTEWIRHNALRHRDAPNTKIGDDAYTYSEWLAAKPRIARVPKRLFAYRQHEESMVATHGDERERFSLDFSVFIDELIGEHIPRQKEVVWCISGMKFFGESISKTLGIPLMVDGFVGDVDTCYIVGLYDPPEYTISLSATKRAKRRVIIWCGTDVQMLVRPEVLPDAIHLCESDLLKRELADMGIEATTVMQMSVLHPEVTPLPEQPKIACFFGNNPERYGAAFMRWLGDIMPDVPIIAFQSGQNSEEQMYEMVADTTVIIRILDHDGGAMSAREWMEGGRYCVTTTEIPYATVVNRRDPLGILRAVKKALAQKGPDYEAAAFYREFNSPERWVAELKEAVDAGS